MIAADIAIFGGAAFAGFAAWVNAGLLLVAVSIGAVLYRTPSAASASGEKSRAPCGGTSR